MAIDFPENPTTGQIYTDNNNIKWYYDGVKWGNHVYNSITELNDLKDFDDPTPSTGNYIGYDNTTGIWKSKPLVTEDIFIRASLSADWDLKDTYGDVIFDVLDYDYNNSGTFNTTTNEFIAPYSQWYTFDLGIHTRPNPSLSVNFYVLKNGTRYQKLTTCSDTAFESSLYGKGLSMSSAHIYCAMGDIIEIETQGINANSNEAWLDSTFCYYQISLKV